MDGQPDVLDGARPLDVGQRHRLAAARSRWRAKPSTPGPARGRRSRPCPRWPCRLGPCSPVGFSALIDRVCAADSRDSLPRPIPSPLNPAIRTRLLNVLHRSSLFCCRTIIQNLALAVVKTSIASFRQHYAAAMIKHVAAAVVAALPAIHCHVARREDGSSPAMLPAPRITFAWTCPTRRQIAYSGWQNRCRPEEGGTAPGHVVLREPSGRCPRQPDNACATRWRGNLARESRRRGATQHPALWRGCLGGVSGARATLPALECRSASQGQTSSVSPRCHRCWKQ